MNRLSSRVQVGSIGARVDMAGSNVGRSVGNGGRVPVTLNVGGREMQAWFEDSFDAEMALAG